MFGSVMGDTVQLDRDPAPVGCSIYILPNRMMDDGERQRMLRHLDLNVKAKFHDNITNLIGICEERDTTLLVLDALGAELKQLLLDSRSLDVSPSHAHKTERFSNMREEDALSIMLGVAHGLDHLVNSGVQPKELCARTVHISHGYKPKIFGFGVADFNKRVISLDLTRWRAPESLLKQQYSSKSLVWSFGCVLWEIVTLGKTMRWCYCSGSQLYLYWY